MGSGPSGGCALSGDRLGLLADPAVRSALSREFGREVEHHARIGSTQDRARSLAEAGSEGALVVADEQTAGHGRQGRPWLAPPGTALLASWLFRPLPADPALFTLLAGVAVARALAALGVDGARLKWPNDVQLGVPPGGSGVPPGGSTGKKVAGTLADAISARGPSADAAGDALVLGIGVNVHQSAVALGGLAAQATSLAIEGHAVDRLALLARIDAELARIAGDPAERRAALEEWRSRSSTLGAEVEVRPPAGAPVRGLARALADDGALVLETASGPQRVVAGEVVAR